MLSQDLDAWLVDVEQAQKPATVAFYRKRSRWIRQSLGELTWEQLTKPTVLRALNQANRWPDQRKKAPDTQRGNIVAWEQFQKWAIATGCCEQPVIAEPIDKPAGRLRERLPNRDEVQQILAKVSPEFAAIYRTLLLTGARPGELCAAQVEQYDTTGGVIVLQDHKTAAKTKRPRAIPIGKAAKPLVLQAIGDRISGPIFRTPYDRAWTTDTLSLTFRRRRDRLQLDREIVLYSTRHRFATELCHGEGLEAAAAVLGHSSLTTTRRYVHHDTTQLVKYADAVDPESLTGQTTH